jgi:hypothetical protein
VKVSWNGLHTNSFTGFETVCCDDHHKAARHWPKVQRQKSATRVRNEKQVVPLSTCRENLARNGVNRCGHFVTLATMPGSLDQFVLIKASKSLGGVWSDDDYIVRDRARNVVVGRIMLHPQAPKDQPWFWTITAREVPPSVHNRGYSATREQAMADFKARYMGRP